MFSKDAHLKFFTDPLSDTLQEGTRIYCNLERVVRGVSLGKIVEVNGFTRYDGTGWRVTPDGYHVSGPVVNNPNSLYSVWYIGMRDADNTIVLGSWEGMHGERGVLSSPRYSDQRSIEGIEAANAHRYLADTWFRAASWAAELWPRATDSDAVVDAKLALAEQRWMHRRAKTVLVAEGGNRGYSELAELIEEGDLPTPKYGAVFNGEVLMADGRAPGRTERSVGLQERLDRLTSKLPGTPDAIAKYVSVRAEFPLPTIDVDGVDSVQSTPAHRALHAVRSHLGDYDLKVGEYALSPVLRSAS